MSDAITATTTALDLVAKLPDMVRAMKSGSLIEYTQPTRVEPIVLIDDKVIGLPYAHDVLQSLCSLFSGYYLQAVALSVNVGRVDVIRMLDRLNPKRDVFNNGVNAVTNGVAAYASLESVRSYAFKLPVPGEGLGIESFGLESVTVKKTGRNINEIIDEAVDKSLKKRKLGNQKPGNTGTTDLENAVKTVTELSNLSVGKLLEVEIESNGHKAVFPVAVRMICNGIKSQDLTHILSVGSKITSAKERFHAWRSGQLEFIRDLVLCQDLIDEHKKTLMRDKSGVYAEILKRRKGNGLSAILSGNPSVATASSLIVMTQATAKELERAVGGRLKDFRTREKIFKETYSMIMVVIDPQWEHITFYHRSIDLPSEYSVKEIQSSNKSKGPDVAEILKAYQMGNSPSI